MLFVPPWAVTRAHAWPRSAWPRARRRTASGSGPAVLPTRSPNTWTNPAAVTALFARLSPESQLAHQPLRPHRSRRRSRGRAFARAANPGDRARAGHPAAARAGVARSRFAEARFGPVDEFAEVLESRDPWRVFLRVHPAVPKSMRTARPQDLLAARERSDQPDPRSRTGSRRSCAWRPSGSGSGPNRCARPSREFSTSATAIGSTWTRCSPPRSPTRSSLCPIHPLVAGPGPSSRTDRARTPAASACWRPHPEFWTENEFHLPQMIATGWLSLPDWYELPAGGPRGERSRADGRVPSAARSCSG